MTLSKPPEPAARAGERRPSHRNRDIWITVAALLVVMAVYAWLVDFVALTGERTVYTADCVGGEWSGNLCTGALAAGDRRAHV